MKKRKKLSSMTAITWHLALFIGILWLDAMACLTLVTAQEIYDRLYTESKDFGARVEEWCRLDDLYNENSSLSEHPDRLENRMLDAVAVYSSYSVYSRGYYAINSGRRNKLIRDIPYPMETAVLFYDGQGNLLHSSSDDIIYFEYYTQAEWDAGEDSTGGLHCGWMDISEGKGGDWQEDLWLRFRSAFGGVRSLYDFPALRVTGYFEGTQLKPVSLYYVTETQIYQVLESTNQFSTGSGSYSYIISDVDRAGLLDWQLQFDRIGEYPDGDLVTVYIDRPRMWSYQGVPLTHSEMEYESLVALMKDINLPSAENRPWGNYCDIGELNELLMYSCRRYADYAGFDYASGGEPQADLYLITAIRSHPLSCAVSALRNIYILTALLALYLFWMVRSSIKKRLVTPLSRINEEMAAGWKNLYGEWEEDLIWKEPYDLIQHYQETQSTLRGQKDELTRLQAALDYAKNAEESRRQMTSNIAHELKTPLAVIHSYAEGLKEHIAEDKRDKYLDIILSETDRTDGIVLEMLDLSRLEAGRVKLSREEFSLAELVRSVFERLEMAVEAKELRIQYVFPDQCMVTADEARMGQVIENFATNAVKYSPVGGLITVRFQRGNTLLYLTVENESEPLSREALSKVWDTFYRTDESRSSPGTGLGLAIAKSIIELHGGMCLARNTKTGVEFGFTLPC